MQLNELKSGIKNGTGVTLSSNAIGDSNDETYFPHQLLLTHRQFPRLHKPCVNNSSANIKLSKTQLSKMVQLGGFLGKLLEAFLKSGLSLMKKVLKPF